LSAVGAIVVVSAFASAIASRLTYRRRRLRWFAEQYRRVREQSAIPSTYAPAAGSQRADRDVQAAEPRPNVTVLGDVAQTRGRQTPIVLRWFVDAAGTTFGCVGNVGGLRMMRLYSSDGTNIYMTASMWRSFAPPPSAPFIKPGFVPYQKGRAYGLTFHQKAMTKARDLVAIHTLDELCAFLNETSRLIVEWRAAQTPDALLEYDLRTLLGKRYDRYAKALARHLKLELPKARLIT
jgi:hypothetical protein